MAAPLTAVLLEPRSDDWDDLTELLEHLSEYHTGAKAQLYTVVQSLAEGSTTSMRVKPAQVDEFVQHMWEFKIRATPQR